MTEPALTPLHERKPFVEDIGALSKSRSGQRIPFRAMDTMVDSHVKAIRVVVADEQPTFRQSLRSLLESECDIEVVGEASDAPSAVDLAGRVRADILLLDFALCQELEVTGSNVARSSLARLRILMMIGNPEKAHVLETFRLGAKGIVLKGSAPGMWSKSIRKVVAGEYWLENESAAILVHALRELLPQNNGASLTKRYGLTPRELEIVERIAHGQSNKEVGLEFSIRERTVKHHLTNIFNKLGVSSRLALALFARDNHILRDS